MNDKQRELIKKIQALAERGEDGEQVNAAKLLKSMMAKLKISLDDLIDESVNYRTFNIPIAEQEIFCQTVLSVIGSKRDIRYNGHRPTKLWIELTDAEYIEIESKFDFIKRIYKKRLSTFKLAFIYAFDLFSHDHDTVKKSSEQELERHREAVNLSRHIKTESYHKQLTT
jgi:hypothetical protein